jgi:hypothetical protein
MVDYLLNDNLWNTISVRDTAVAKERKENWIVLLNAESGDDLSLNSDEIVSEALYRRAIGGRRTGTVFEHEGNEITLGSSINKSSINREANPKMSYLSFLVINYNIPIIREVQNWLESCLVFSYANSMTERRVMLSTDEKIRNRFIQALNDMEIDMRGYRFDEEGNQLYTQRTLSGKVYELLFTAESDGTKQLIAALPGLLLVLQAGRLIIIDELDAKLYPKLLQYVISLFKNPKFNTKSAQLMFTSHDMTTMKIPYSAMMKSGLQQKMQIMKVKYTLFTRFGVNTSNVQTTRLLMISSTWKVDMAQIHI